jgi:tetratricopeptide (TPR) repeat protein
MMASRLLSRLDADIAAAKHPLKADCLRAERAGFLARQGHLDEARQVLSSLHMQYAANPHAVMSAWLSLGEGLLSHFSDLAPAAHDRMRRAYALSGAARDMKLHALSAAWLAHMDYTQYDFDAMVRHVGEALTLSDAADHGVRTRACLVVAQAYHFGGRYDLAQPWYTKSRQHAATDGDEATLSALMHNMAWLHASHARQQTLTASGTGGVTPQMLMSAESTGNFDVLVGTASLDALLPILRAQILSLQGKCADALVLYDQHMAQAMVQGLARMQGSLRADMAWCRLQVGDERRAMQDARAAAQATEHETDLDDRAAAHSRLARVFAELGEAGTAERHALRAGHDWRAHERDQVAVVEGLNRLLEKLAA